MLLASAGLSLQHDPAADFRLALHRLASVDVPALRPADRPRFALETAPAALPGYHPRLAGFHCRMDGAVHVEVS